MKRTSRTESMKQQIIAAAYEAQQAFWAEVAKQFPQADSSDINPLFQKNFDEHCETIVQHWVDYNIMRGGNHEVQS